MATQLTLKLLVDSSSQKVLFAEAGKEVVDFLLGLLTLPLGTVIKLLSEERGGEHHMSGSIGNLYESLNALDDSYFESSRSKSGLLLATQPFSVLPSGFLLPAAALPAGRKSVTDGTSAGFMKGVVTYTVTDDLLVSPMSSISSITLLNKLNVKDVGSLQEKTIVVDHAAAIGLLKASLQSKSVLTDVFLAGKK